MFTMYHTQDVVKFPKIIIFSSFVWPVECSIQLWSDTFDENTPPVDDPNYITTLGSAIYKAMCSGDDNAIWLMQVTWTCETC